MVSEFFRSYVCNKYYQFQFGHILLRRCKNHPDIAYSCHYTVSDRGIPRPEVPKGSPHLKNCGNYSENHFGIKIPSREFDFSFLEQSQILQPEASTVWEQSGGHGSSTQVAKKIRNLKSSSFSKK